MMSWPGWLAVVLWIIFTIAVEADAISTYFGLAPTPEQFIFSVWAGVLVWALLLRTIWRAGWADKLLTL